MSQCWEGVISSTAGMKNTLPTMKIPEPSVYRLATTYSTSFHLCARAHFSAMSSLSDSLWRFASSFRDSFMCSDTSHRSCIETMR